MKNKSLIDTIILAVMVALLIIGAHQTWTLSKTEGFKIAFFKNYFLFMFILILMAVYQIRKNKRERQEEFNKAPGSKTSVNKKPKKGK